MGPKVPFLLLATVMLAGDTPAQDAVSDAQRFLQVEKGLRNTAGGTVWLSQAERSVRQALADLEDTRRGMIKQQQWLDERIRRNRAAWEANQRRIAALQKALTSPDADQADKREIKDQIEGLKSRSVAPDRLAAQADVRSNLIKLTNSRHRLALSLLELRRLIPDIDGQYAQLASEPGVQQALRTLGPAHRLGPLPDGYGGDLRRLGEYDREVFTPWIPAYLQSDRVRVGAIVNERIPITFTWLESNDPAVLTAAMAEVAGLGVPKTQGQTVPISMGGGRRVPVYRATVPSLRFGQHVIRDVPCLVLPPEAEDLGGQIGVDAFSKYETRIEIENLRIVIRSKDSETAEETKAQ
jgi:hypothetical protein